MSSIIRGTKNRCGTCVHWDGARRFVNDTQIDVGDASKKGACRQFNKSMHGGNTCSNVRFWSPAPTFGESAKKNVAQVVEQTMGDYLQAKSEQFWRSLLS